MIQFILGLVLIIANGLLLLKLLNFKSNFSEALALSFLLGSGLNTILYFRISFESYHTVPETFWLLLICELLFLLLVAVVKKVNLVPPSLPKINIGRDKFVLIIQLMILVLASVSMFYAYSIPVHTTDSIHLYDFRAKVLYLSNSLLEMRQVVDSWYQYPMLTSLINLFERFMGIRNPSIYYPVMFFAFGTIFFNRLRNFTTPRIAALVTLLMYSTPLIYWQSVLDGLTNLPYTIYFCLSILYFLSYAHAKKWSLVLIGMLFLALSSWTRVTEPFWVVSLAYMVLILAYTRQFPLLFFNYYVFSKIRDMWDLFADNRKHISFEAGTKTLFKFVGKGETIGTPVSSVKTSPLVLILHALPIISQIFYETGLFIFPIFIINLRPGIYVFLLTLTVDLVCRKFHPLQKHLIIILASLTALLWLGTVYSSIAFDNWQELGNSLGRIIGFFVPLLWFYVGLSANLKKLPFLNNNSLE